MCVSILVIPGGSLFEWVPPNNFLAAEGVGLCRCHVIVRCLCFRGPWGMLVLLSLCMCMSPVLPSLRVRFRCGCVFQLFYHSYPKPLITSIVVTPELLQELCIPLIAQLFVPSMQCFIAPSAWNCGGRIFAGRPKCLIKSIVVVLGLSAFASGSPFPVFGGNLSFPLL